MTRTEAIRFKGTRQGVHLLIEPDSPFAQVLVELDQRLRGSDQFFRSASVALHLGSRDLDSESFNALRDVLNRFGLRITSAQALHSDTRAVLRAAGVELEAEEAAPTFEPRSGSREAPGAERPASAAGIVVHRTLRSGMTIRHPGDICLIGDVNPGAEIVAGENVIIWGSLRGVVQAGIDGSEDAVICALELAPTQMRIASVVTRQPEGGQESHSEVIPELARLADGQIVVEQWLPRARRVRVLRG